MKKLKQLIVIVPVLLSVISQGSGGASVGGSGGDGSTGDSLKYTCQSCLQIPPPTTTCTDSTEAISFCGSEAWVHNNEPDCKTFLTHVRSCIGGGTQTWTDTLWTGVGSDCHITADNHECH